MKRSTGANVRYTGANLRSTAMQPSLIHNRSLWQHGLLGLFIILVALAPLAQTGRVARAGAPLGALAANAVWTFTAPVGWAASPTVVCVTVTDADGLQGATTEYALSTTAGALWSGWISSSLQISSPVSTTAYLTATVSSFVDSATANQIQFRMRDNLANLEISSARTVAVDSAPPGAPVSLAANPPGWSPNNNFTITWSNPAELSGVARAYYKLGAAPLHPSDYSGTQAGSNIAQLSAISVASTGATPCYVWLQDAVGNANYASAASVTLYYSGSAAPPAPFALQITPASWTNQCSYNLTWTNPPPETTPSGIQAAWYKWDSAPTFNDDGTRVAGLGINALNGLLPPGVGVHAIYVWLEDGAGARDYHNTRSVVAQCDTTPPIITPTYDPPLPASGWFSRCVTVTLLTSDSLSGVQETHYRRQGGLWRLGDTFSSCETQTYEYYSTDNAGNSTGVQEITVRLDMVPPTSVANAATEPVNGWYSRSVTVTIVAEDSLSGWAGESYYRIDGAAWQRGAQAVVSGDGEHTFEYYSCDVAGNCEAPQFITFPVDTQPPSVLASYTPGACAWLRPPVTVTISANDALSAVDVVEYRLLNGSEWIAGQSFIVNGASGDGNYVYSYRARDRAGNISAGQTITVPIDATPPASPAGAALMPAGWTNNNVFSLCWTNPADLSGIVAAYYAIDDQTYGPIAGASISCLNNLSVPTEGEHTICVWLVDCAGNSDPATKVCRTVQYDASPPYVDEAEVSGPEGCENFLTGCVTVTFTAHDALSTLAAICYQVEGQAEVCRPVTGIVAQYTLNLCPEDGRRIIRYWARDMAGNSFEARILTLYVDSRAPASPGSLAVTPAAWSNVNSFSVCWTNPADYAGVEGAYVKKGSPPTANADGQLYATLPYPPCVTGITVDEGETPVYVWLRDRACNVDYRTAISVPLRYDHTPPTTTPSVVAGTPGRNGWYISPITLRFQVTDRAGTSAKASGVALTYYRLDGGPEQLWNGQDLALSTEGVHTVSCRSADNAGNLESWHDSAEFKIDLSTPTAALRVAADYTQSPSVLVNWSGQDAPTGSGVEQRYTVEVREGCSQWAPWLTDTANNSGTYGGMRANKFYSFRVKAEDRAGRVSVWTAAGRGDSVYIEGLSNPSFDLCDWGAWVPYGDLGAGIVRDTGRDGQQSCMAQLSHEWPPEYASVPVNEFGAMYQAIELPSVPCGRGLVLTFWYHIRSYDVGWSKDYQKWYDTFEVYVRDRDGNQAELARLLRDGNTIPPPGNVIPPLQDLGWRQFSADLTPWAGQQVRLDFRVWNRVDGWYPTWVQIDDVKLLPSAGRVIALPLIRKTGASGAAAGSVEQPSAEPQMSLPTEADMPPRR